ncbi:MAG: Na(+)/H(+) antiporter subunit D [Omnitrophica bacterium RIFCSPLOWO2_12_FULL_50_11]|nr:MAG: Na(+)/H(+) antiporter subunit D [Omnitrophica bacterium RIFCSPLOWO2_12_FULL_50_11]
MIEWIHPAFFFFVGAAILPFVKGRGRSALLLSIPVLSFLSLLFASQGIHGAIPFIGQKLIFGRVDKLSMVFGYAFTIIAFIGMVYALHVQESGEHIVALLYAGSALGVIFAGDLFSLFLFWEIMAFSSVFLIWFKGGESSNAAGMRYLLVHIFGGLCLLGGIVIHASSGGTAFSSLPHTGLGPTLILIGFLLNAAVPPLHAWLADAYPEATVTGIVFLSVFTTKTAVYVLVRGFPGMEILIIMGAIMAVYGIVYAMLENDTRRLLAYHIISQVGYMVVGVGIGTDLALNGAVAFAFTNILYKALLLMGMSSVLFMTGKRKATELGGLYRTMPWTFLLFMIGGFSISGVPLFSGFISKSMVVSAAVETHQSWAFLLLTLASAGTLLSTTLKLPYAVFLGEDKKIPATDPPDNMLYGMGLAAFICILLGLWPDLLYRLLPYPVEYHPYTGEHLVGSLQILGFTALGFVLFLNKMRPENTISLDIDWFYRKATAGFLWLANRLLGVS